MQQLAYYVSKYGLSLIFVNVLLEQMGLPIPAIPVLVVAGALAVERDLSAPRVVLVAVLASLIADALWYALGKQHGFRVLKTLCRVSLSPDSCVRQTTSIFEKWGLPSLVVAKFVPGFSTVAPPLAGAINARFLPFLLYDGAGALVWAGAGVAAGMAFHRAIDRGLEFLTGIGSWALVVLGAALALFILVKWWQRRRFYKLLRMARISPEELHRLMDEGHDPVVLDVRTDGARLADPRRIPGARLLALSDIPEKLAGLPRDREIILYCT
ncbi:MAG TPA: VTT domain-containing protein [Thermoanaerobaculia bacterium]|nr:VTT domain-containing protein [Thermoanaerobaculia bacterium]HSP92958.1 VTT domain-containing protein [Thermoanaerobaculia bacterium]